MKVVIRKRLLRRILQWTQRLLAITAILLLGYCGFVLVDTWAFQHRQNRILQQLLNTHPGPSDAVVQFRAAKLTHGPPAIAAGGLIGRIEIPRLKLSAIVMEGDNPRTLRRAVGHMAGSPLPGQVGNVALTGHRDTFFRPLRNIRRGDIIVVTTLQGEYRYRVMSTKVVGPNDVAVLSPSVDEILTLVTCYPFYFVGAAPDRFIVRAERVA
jgi:LPXTG-site transpeptidase (sortase) family protein